MATLNFLDPPARVVVKSVRLGVDHRLFLSAVALGLTMILGLTYLTFGALRVNPAASDIRVMVHLRQSGGLLPGQDVTVRGVSVGRVEAIELSDAGVVAVARIDSATKIPASATAGVAALSAAGEQYLDFRPMTVEGPYLGDNAVIPVDRTSTPTPIAQVLGALEGTLAQIEPDQLEAIVDELGVGPEGVRKLDSIVDGGIFMLSTLDAALPQTVSLLKSSKVVLGTVADAAPTIRGMSADLSSVFTGVARMDGGFRELVDAGPEAMSAVDALFAENSPTMVSLLGNLVTVAELSYQRVPALKALFPDHRGSVLEAIGSTFRDGGTWGIVDLYPRYVCDYDLPRKPAAIPDYPEPYLYTYCNNPDPGILVRGARNAPRPEGDDTAGPPAGVDLNATADPTPRGPLTVQTPYGGPTVPLAPPP